MRAIGRMVGWLGRKALLYAVLVAALVAATLVTPLIESEWTGPGETRGRLGELRGVQSRLAGERRVAEKRLRMSIDRTRGAGVAAIDARLAAARRRLATLEDGRARSGVGARFLLGGAQAVLADQQREVEIAVARREIASLERARALAMADADLSRFTGLPSRARAADARGRACVAAQGQVARFQRRWFGSRLWDRAAGQRLARERDARCAGAERARNLVIAELAARARALAARKRARAALEAETTRIGPALALAIAALDAQIRDDAALLDGSLRRKAELFAERVDLAGKMAAAALALLAIIASPLLIRLFCYHVLAPAAMRRPAIRLRVPGGAGAAIPPAGRSATSVGVRLAPDEELLVRQDYLQTTSQAGAKDTRWLLDLRHPVTSIACGLTFLTRIRGEGEVTTISAVRDPFAEVTVLTLPAGAACVLQPRALAAVARPIGRPLRVETRWRLGSLSAWLTLQLRYVIFHGPARLVVKGGRGVRVERAEAGRVFGQDQLVGFSADLAYSVTRAETFWPYLLGREPLLKDRVEAGAGMLVVEEAPGAGRRGGGRRGGIEGLVDAGMKVLGM